MASSPFLVAAQKAVVLLGGTVFLLAGCGSDDSGSNRDASAPAATPTATAGPTGPDTTTSPNTAAPLASEVEVPEETAATEEAEASAAEEPADELVITIVDFTYQLPETVPPGSTITVVNEDSAAHTVTSSGAFDVNLTGGQTGTFTAPEEPGEYRIICLFHGNMTATLVVG